MIDLRFEQGFGKDYSVIFRTSWIYIPESTIAQSEDEPILFRMIFLYKLADFSEHYFSKF